MEFDQREVNSILFDKWGNPLTAVADGAPMSVEAAREVAVRLAQAAAGLVREPRKWKFVLGWDRRKKPLIIGE